MVSPPKPWQAKYAKSSSSSCKACKKPIDKETLRLGKIVQATKFDGFMPYELPHMDRPARFFCPTCSYVCQIESKVKIKRKQY